MNENTKLTKREYFASVAMQAIVTQGSLKPNLTCSIAIDYADTLIEMLDYPKNIFTTEARELDMPTANGLPFNGVIIHWKIPE
jgi:hypothetical protein